eukprot:2120579-Rhodomonas_salina.3
MVLELGEDDGRGGGKDGGVEGWGETLRERVCERDVCGGGGVCVRAIERDTDTDTDKRSSSSMEQCSAPRRLTQTMLPDTRSAQPRPKCSTQCLTPLCLRPEQLQPQVQPVRLVEAP